LDSESPGVRIEQAKVNRDLLADWHTVSGSISCRFHFPVADYFHGRLIEARFEASGHSRLVELAVDFKNCGKQYSPLGFLVPGDTRVRRIRTNKALWAAYPIEVRKIKNGCCGIGGRRKERFEFV